MIDGTLSIKCIGVSIKKNSFINGSLYKTIKWYGCLLNLSYLAEILCYVPQFYD